MGSGSTQCNVMHKQRKIREREDRNTVRVGGPGNRVEVGRSGMRIKKKQYTKARGPRFPGGLGGEKELDGGQRIDSGIIARF